MKNFVNDIFSWKSEIEFFKRKLIHSAFKTQIKLSTEFHLSCSHAVSLLLLVIKSLLLLVTKSLLPSCFAIPY